MRRISQFIILSLAVCQSVRSLSGSVLVNFGSFCRDIELEVDDITIKDLIIATLLEVKSFVLDFRLSSTSVQILELHDLSANEATLEIGVNDTCSSRSLGALADSPALNLVLASSEVVNKLKCAIASIYELVHHRGLTKLGSSGISSSLIW